MNAPINCHLHDYIEIACLYHFEVEFNLANGKVVKGRAQTTHTDKNSREFLRLMFNKRQLEIDLHDIKTMCALTANPHFDKVEFGQA